jgi:CheY-like chemotaxis protein
MGLLSTRAWIYRPLPASLTNSPPYPNVIRLFTILVVERESTARDLVMRMLSEKGFGVLRANDGYEALRILSERPVDLLFADIGMLGIDGVQLATQAKMMQSGLKVLFATGYAQRATERATERAAMHLGRVLFKPLREAMVLREVEALLAA